jgi:hypothetical protein
LRFDEESIASRRTPVDGSTEIAGEFLGMPKRYAVAESGPDRLVLVIALPGGLPSDAAIESAVLGSTTLTRQNYQDNDGFTPRAAKKPATFATWSAWNAGTRYSILNINALINLL